eukprot:gene23399-9665_t
MNVTRNNQTEVLFDHTEHEICQITTSEEVHENDSRVVWEEVAEALNKRDIDQATVHKTKLENEQRKIRAARQANDDTFCSNIFVLNGSGQWLYK